MAHASTELKIENTADRNQHLQAKLNYYSCFTPHTSDVCVGHTQQPERITKLKTNMHLNASH